MLPPPPGIRVEPRAGAVELAIGRPVRVRRGLVLAGASGLAFAVAALATALDSRASKEAVFVIATVLFACFVGSIRAVILGLRPLRLVLDAERLVVRNPRLWSGQNVRLARASVTNVEQMPNGVAARLPDGRLVPIVRELGSEEATFVEAALREALHSAAASAASSTSAAAASARASERSFASST